VIYVALIFGGVVAYILFDWIGVTYYLLVIDWIFVVGFALLIGVGTAHLVRYARVELIPDMRVNRLVKFYNLGSGRPISLLNVHVARVVEYGITGDEVGVSPLLAEATFGGNPLEEVKLLRSRTFYMITTNSSIELWERRKAEFHVVAWFDKEEVETKVHAHDHNHTVELRFPEGTFVLLTYGAA